MKKRSLLLALAGATLFSTGCNYFFWQSYWPTTTKFDAASVVDDANDPVLLKIDGKPMLRKAEFLEFVEQAIKANPYLSSFGISSYDNAPEPIRQQLLDAVIQQKLIALWGHKEGLDKTAQYKQSYERLSEQLSQALIAQAFEKQILETISVSDAEVAAEFERSHEQMIKNPGQVKAVGVSFKSEEKSKIFYDLVAHKEESTFNDLAKESGVEPIDLGSVSLDPRIGVSGNVPAVVKRALMGLKENEYYAQAKDGDIYWVVQVTDRIKPTLFTFDEVRDDLAASVRHEKFKTIRESRVNELRALHTIDIDKASLGTGQDPLAMLQQLLAAQGGGAFAGENDAADKDVQRAEESDDMHDDGQLA